MTTMVGKEHTLIELLQDLITLDYDAIKAYEAAIKRLDNTSYQTKLREFCEEHRRHTTNLAPFLEKLGARVPHEADAKSVLTTGKVVLANMIGDHAIIRAMKTNEDDTNTAYERAVQHKEVTPEVRTVLQSNLEDERRHRQWMIATLNERKAA